MCRSRLAYHRTQIGLNFLASRWNVITLSRGIVRFRLGWGGEGRGGDRLKMVASPSLSMTKPYCFKLSIKISFKGALEEIIIQKTFVFPFLGSTSAGISSSVY